MYSTHAPSAGHVDRLRRLGASVSVAHSEGDALAAAPEAEVVLGHRYLRQVLPSVRRLRWVQSTAGGTDRLPEAALKARGITLTRMADTAPAIARHAVTLAWSLTRNLPAFVRQHDAGRWAPPGAWLPAPRRGLVLGTGAIGSAIAARLGADDVEVLGVRQSDRPAPPGVDVLLRGGAWRGALPTVDWLFLALPHTPATAGFVGEAELRALPPHAVVVNVGRGETLDTAALCRTLADGHLGGAALDVVAPRPSGPDDPIWTTPRLLLTPHVASHRAERATQIEATCEAQVARYLAGEPLRHVVS